MIEKAIQMYVENNFPISKIAKEFHIDRHRLSRELRNRGVVVSRTSSKYKYTEDYFEDISTENKAYWLGFMYADGYVSLVDNKIELGLKESDVSHIEKLRDEICPGKPIQYKKSSKSYRLCCTNKPLAKSLANCGCVPNKSLVLTFPTKEVLPKEMYKHFIRGYFDGDGCISYSTNNGLSISVQGTKQFIGYIRDFLTTELGLTTTTLIIKKSVVEWRKTGVQAKKVLDYLYRDSNISLYRKYNKYVDYCRLEPKLQKTQDD